MGESCDSPRLRQVEAGIQELCRNGPSASSGQVLG